MLGLSGTFHPLMAFPSYIEIADKPLEERVRLLRDPQRRARILSESPVRLAKEGFFCATAGGCALCTARSGKQKLLHWGILLCTSNHFKSRCMEKR